MGDSNYWDEKFKARRAVPLAPEPEIVACDGRIGADDRIYKSDIAELETDFQLIRETEKTDERGHFATYILKRKEKFE
jgi:hypothetical protein